MADFLGQVFANCNDNKILPGMADCDIQEDQTRALIFHARNAVYSGNPETFIEELHDHTISDGSDRLIIVDGVKSNTPSGGEFDTADDGDSGEQVTRRLSARTDVYLVRGGECRYKALRHLNNRSLRVMRYDASRQIIATAKSSGIAGFQTASIYVRRRPTTGSDAYGVEISVSYSNNYEREQDNLHAFTISELPEGLMGIALKPGAAGTASVVTACGGQDITAEYADEWDPTMFVTADGSNPTTVTYDGDTGLLTIAPAGAYRPASAKILDAGNVIGFEGTGAYAQITA